MPSYTKEELRNQIVTIFHQCPGNHVTMAETADAENAEIDLFAEPLIGFSSAADPLFETYKTDKEVIGPFYMKPEEWLSGAKTVIALFLPFSERVRKSNRKEKDKPSLEWLYARIEGQAFMNRLMGEINEWLVSEGIAACVPTSDERFKVIRDTVVQDGITDFHVESKWSERHAAYVSGLGTFGLSRGLISKAGMAGRYASVIVDLEVEPDERDYTGVYDYCTRCGVCARNCPAQAITLECGKHNQTCSDYVNRMKEEYAPRYGCGKCQVGVPCEFAAPGRGRA